MPPSAERQIKTHVSVTLLPLELGKCLCSCSAGIFITALSEALAVSEGCVSALAAGVNVSRSLVSWFGDWKPRAAAAGTEWGTHSGNFSSWEDVAIVLIS